MKTITGFFYDIRSHMVDRRSGRYLALLLREIARHEPKTFASILGLAGRQAGVWKELCRKVARSEFSVEKEIGFQGANGRRYADLAILDEFGKPAAFIEVKEDDIKNPSNAAQLDDYLSQGRQGIPFIHLSRFSLGDAERGVIARAKRGASAAKAVVSSLRYRDIHRILLSDRPLAKMLREYMEDIGVGTYTTIEPEEDRSLAFLLTQMLGFPHVQGLGRLQGAESVAALPKLMQRLFDNIEYVAEWVHQANRGLIGQRFTRKLSVQPDFDLPKLAKAIGKKQDEGSKTVGVLPGKSRYVRSGNVYFWAGGRIRTPKGVKPPLGANDWVYVELGFGLEVSRGKRGARRANTISPVPIVRPYVYAEFNGNTLKDNDTFHWTGYLKRFPTANRVLPLFQRVLTRSLKDALASKNLGVRVTLKQFKIPEVE